MQVALAMFSSDKKYRFSLALNTENREDLARKCLEESVVVVPANDRVMTGQKLQKKAEDLEQIRAYFADHRKAIVRYYDRLEGYVYYVYRKGCNKYTMPRFRVVSVDTIGPWMIVNRNGREEVVYLTSAANNQMQIKEEAS